MASLFQLLRRMLQHFLDSFFSYVDVPRIPLRYFLVIDDRDVCVCVVYACEGVKGGWHFMSNSGST